VHRLTGIEQPKRACHDRPEKPAPRARRAVEYPLSPRSVILKKAMNTVVIAFTPVFAAFVIAEGRHLARGGRYDTRGAVTNVLMGLGNAALAVCFGGLGVAAYTFAYSHRAMTMPRTWLAFALLVVLEDLCYYWFHRVSHVTRLWWAAHEAHHSSASYNLSTAVRQTWTGWIHTWIFWLPLPLLGFPVQWILLQQALSLTYQFFIHTELVGKLGPLEWILNTPSHHRVHHATNIEYLDKNYGGIFIVWDRLFGTFAAEEASCRYGLVKPLPNQHPLTIAFGVWLAMARDVVRARSWRGRLGYLFAPPGWNEDGTGMTSR
jgi:sterol desaturase/sphingolipid hydroxylase (fatty acid hydroxylase superfamily)